MVAVVVVVDAVPESIHDKEKGRIPIEVAVAVAIAVSSLILLMYLHSLLLWCVLDSKSSRLDKKIGYSCTGSADWTAIIVICQPCFMGGGDQKVL